MSIYSLADLRATAPEHLRGAADNELVQAYADSIGQDPVSVAQTLGMGPTGGKNASRMSAALDSYQGNLYGLGEAGAGKLGMSGVEEWMRKQRKSNELDANLASARARSLGAVDSWENVHGVRDFGDYAVGLGIQSLPYMGEAIVGGMTGGATAALSGAGRAGVMAARTAGAVTASYPSAVGDILSNQREQSGTTDLGSAAALAVPYAAANAFGVEGALARGHLFRNGVRALDDVGGAKGALARTAVTGGRTAAVESANETFQEGMNQFGRMAVDPNETFYNERSAGRFKESAIGGAVLGGALGGAGGGWRRSGAPVRTVDEGAMDLFNQPGSHLDQNLGLSSYGPDEGPMRSETAPVGTQPRAPIPGQYEFFNPDGSPTYGADPSFGDTYPLSPFEPEWGTSPGAAPARPGGLPFTPGVSTRGLGLAPQLDDGATVDMFTGERTMAPSAPAPELELTGYQDPAQREMDFAPVVSLPTAPALPHSNQRGIPGQLPFSPNASSPKGQVLQGLVDSLAAEGHIEDGTMVSTLIARGRFGDAKKLIDQALKNKQAADDLTQKAQEAEMQQAANAQRREQAEEVYQESVALRAKKQSLLDKAGRAPREGTKKRKEWDAVEAQLQGAIEKWSELTRPPKKENPNAPATGTPGGGIATPAGAGGVQRGGSDGVRADVQPDAVPSANAPAPAQPGGETGAAVQPGGEPVRALAEFTSDALAERTDQDITQQEYEDILDELYARWRDDGDRQAEAFFEANAGNKGFKADLARTRERAGETAQKPASEGKRGLKLGPVETGKLDESAKEMDGLMRSLVSIKQSTDIQNPDTAANETAIPPGVTFTNAREAAEWLAANSKSAPLRFVMKKIAPHLDGVDVNLVQIGDQVESRIAAHLNGRARAVTVLRTFGKGNASVYVRGYDSNTETVWAHELVHAATMGRLRDAKLRAPLRALAVQVRNSLLQAINRNDRSSAEMEFFEGQFKDTDEFIAYAMTSPTFQRFMANLGPDGKWLTPKQAERPQDVPTYSLWKRFVDMIRDLFGLPKVYAREIEKIIAANQEVEARNAAPQPTLEGTLNQLLDELLASPNPWIIQSQPAGTGGIKAVSDSGRVEVKASSASAPRSSAVRSLADKFGQTPAGKTSLGQRVHDGLFNMSESPWALRWTTNDQIAEAFKHLKPVQDINRATSRMASVANRYLEAAAQTTKKWRALPDDVQLAMQKLMLRTTMAEAHVAIKGAEGRYLSVDDAWKHASNKHLDQDTRGEFGKMYQEWAGLTPAAKTVYDQVRDDLHRQHEDTLKALRRSVAQAYGAQLRRVLSDEELLALSQSDKSVREIYAQVLGDSATKAEQRALAGLYGALRDVNSNFGTVRGPYFPLVRFGDHVVVMKAKALVDLELEATSLRTQMQQTMEQGAPDDATDGYDAKLEDLRARLKKADAAIEAAKQDDKQYTVEFHESAAEAERSLKALQAKYPDADSYRSVKEQYYRGLDGASNAFISDLQQTIAAALDAGDGVTGEAKAAVLQSVKDLYMRRQPERSALRAELKRMGIEGVKSGQMLRGYAQTARNGAWRISRLQHSGDITSGLQALSEDKRNPDAKHVLNELKARFIGDLVPPSENKFLQNMSGLTYFMHLGFNVSYFTTNATQAWVTSLPVMAGRHGLVNAGNSLSAASKDVIALLKAATAESVRENGKLVGLQLRLSDDQITSLARDAGEAAMLKRLTEDGVIDITIKHDLGAQADGSSDSFAGKVLELSSALANYPELYNRLSTALAAYRMEKAYRGEANQSADEVQQRAEQYAEYTINRTHFNYSPENAPRIMRGQLARMIFQFKRYQQGMIYLFVSLSKKALHGDKEAMQSLAYLLGTNLAVGGVVSLPIAAPVALAAKLMAAAYDDDDEPQWMQQFYNGMKDAVGEDIAQALVKGLPTLGGIDLSGKLGQGNLLNPIAFADTQGKKVFSKEYFQAVGFALLGPAASLTGTEAEAVGHLKDGNLLKAAETGMPTFLANAIKAYRRADQGLTTRRGDTIMEADEFSAVSIGAKALGFESVKVSDTYDQRSAYLNMVQGRKDARQALLREYYDAVKTGDSDKMAAVRERVAAFNERQPADRVRGQDLSASIKARQRQALETREGLRVGRRDQDTFRRLTGE